jgi:hypothetical protein
MTRSMNTTAAIAFVLGLVALTNVHAVQVAMTPAPLRTTGLTTPPAISTPIVALGNTSLITLPAIVPALTIPSGNGATPLALADIDTLPAASLGQLLNLPRSIRLPGCGTAGPVNDAKVALMKAR